jgi:hypothetical protein
MDITDTIGMQKLQPEEGVPQDTLCVILQQSLFEI